MTQFVEKPATTQSLAQRKPLYGIGINDAAYNVSMMANGKKVRCQFYKIWSNMIERCYCAKYQEKRPNHKACTVSNEWLTFSNFRKWMETQDWKGKALDKDLLIDGNKEYGKDSCMFVDHSINALMNNHLAGRGLYKQGVTMTKDGKYKASCSVNGKMKHLGRFSTENKAYAVYLSFKADLIQSIAVENSHNEKLKQALITQSNITTKKIIKLLQHDSSDGIVNSLK